MGSSVFISYSHADQEVAEALERGLSARGFKVWIDAGELRGGDSIIDRVASAIHEVGYVAVLVSQNSVTSRWCQKELSLAMTGELNQAGVKVVPLRLGNVEMPHSISDKFYLQVDPLDINKVMQRLAIDIKRHAGVAVVARLGPSKSFLTLHEAASGADLLRQYLQWFYAEDYASCFKDRLLRQNSKEMPAAAPVAILYWLNALPALSGLRDTRAAHSDITMFAGLAEFNRDYSDPEQAEMSKAIDTLYFGR